MVARVGSQGSGGPTFWRPAGPEMLTLTPEVVKATLGGGTQVFSGAAGAYVLELIEHEIAEVERWLGESFVLARRQPLLWYDGEKRPRLEGLGALVGPAGVFEGADSAYVLLATVGTGLEAEVAARFSRGDVVGGMVLDAVGTVLVGALTESFLDEVESEVPVGLLLQPGCHYLPMSLQRRIVALLDAVRYGVAITESLMLRPAKSVTSVVPVGEHLASRRGQVVLCDLCNMRVRCQYRVFAHLGGGGFQ